jgi:hypothetical protein
MHGVWSLANPVQICSEGLGMARFCIGKSFANIIALIINHTDKAC